MSSRCLSRLALVQLGLSDALTTHSATAGPSAIKRVVTLLEEMQATMQKEQKEDQANYDKMVCWCQTTEEEKTKAVADAETAIVELESMVEGNAAEDATLATNTEQLQKELQAKKNSLSTATAIREKEAASFREEEKDMVQAVTNLKNAIMVLKRQNGFFQLSAPLQETLRSVLSGLSARHEEMVTLGLDEGSAGSPGTAFLQQGTKSVDRTLLDMLPKGPSSELPPEFAAQVLAEAAKGTATAFIQAPDDHWEKKPGGQEAYNSRSGQIFGILKTMQEDFESNLSQSQKDELKAAEEFTTLKAAATEEIEHMQEHIDKLQGKNSAAVKALSDAKEDLALTREQRSADVKFLSDLNLQCKDLDRQFEQRTEARMQEITAVSEAMDIITGDDARELMQKKFGPNLLQESATAASFLQVGDTSRALAAARSRAARALLAASKALKDSPDFGDLLSAYRGAFKPAEEKPHEQLSALAVTVQLDGFQKVKKACDDMINDLKTQQQEEVELKTRCTADLNVNEKETYTTSEELKDIKSNIEALENTIAKLVEEMKEAQDEIAAMNSEIKGQSLQRKKDNEVFQQAVADERAVQKVLSMASDRLKQVYKSPGGEFVQQDPVSPVQFTPTKKNAGGSSVVSLIEQIIEDSKKVEADLEAAENSAQSGYATFANDATATIKSLNAIIEEKNKAKSASDLELAKAEEQAASTQESLDNLADLARDLHEQCDFVVQNFDVRQKARLQEIEAIQKAKGFLSGMKDGD